MLNIIIEPVEQYDSVNEEFIFSKRYEFKIEHSLVSLTKWESRWCKPFIDKEPKTHEEILDYVRCMTITQNVPNEAYSLLSTENFRQINKYIELPMTATRLNHPKSNGSSESVTSELLYYWMISQNIPFECQKWHLNRLLMLINVCNVKNSPPKKMSRQELIDRNTRLNAERKKRLNSEG